MAISCTLMSKAHKVIDGDGLKAKFVRINLGAYATGGVAIAPSDVGLREIYMIHLQIPLTTNIKGVVYDVANKKILAYSDWAATEVANTTDLSAQPVYAFVVGV